MILTHKLVIFITIMVMTGMVVVLVMTTDTHTLQISCDLSNPVLVHSRSALPLTYQQCQQNPSKARQMSLHFWYCTGTGAARVL